jgi:hypothetical protein
MAARVPITRRKAMRALESVAVFGLLPMPPASTPIRHCDDQYVGDELYGDQVEAWRKPATGRMVMKEAFARLVGQLKKCSTSHFA